MTVRRSIHFLMVLAIVMPLAPVSAQEVPVLGQARPPSLLEAPIRDVPDRILDIQRTDAVVTVSPDDRTARIRLAIEASVRADSLVQWTWPSRAVQVDSVWSDTADVVLGVQRGDSIVFTSRPLGPGTTVRFSIAFRTVLGGGIRTSGDPLSDGFCCVWTESDAWHPLPSDPGDRFAFMLTFDVPDDWRIAAVGRRTGPRTFASRRPAAAHHLHFSAGPLPTRQVGSRIRVFGSADLEDRIPAVFEHLSRTTGYSLPWDSLRVFVRPDAVSRQRDALRGGAIGPGYVTIDASWTVAQLADALARQWTGVVLAPEWWTEGWMSNALAGYLALRVVEDLEGPDAAASRRADLWTTYLAESRRYRRPLVWDRYTVPEDLRDAHALGRGPLFLSYLAGRYGQGTVDSAIRTLLARRAFAPVVTEDLADALSSRRVAGVTALFDAWVYGAGHPVLSIDTRFDADSEELRVTLRQIQDGMLVPSAFTIETTASWLLLGSEGSVPVILAERESELRTPVAMRPRYYFLDPDGTMPAETAYDQPMSAWSAALRYGTFPLRLEAARAMAAYADDPTALLALRLAIAGEESAHIRAELVRVAAGYGDSRSRFDFLLAAVDDADSRVRHTAVDALAALGDEAAASVVEVLGRIAQTDASARVQAAAVVGLARIGAPEALRTARSAAITSSDDEVIRQAAFEAILLLDPADDLVTEMLLEHTDPDLAPAHIAVALVLAPAATTSREVRIRMLRLLGHPLPDVRLETARWADRVLLPGNARAVRALAADEWHPLVRHALNLLAERLTDAG